jgi:hypothetical protein
LKKNPDITKYISSKMEEPIVIQEQEPKDWNSLSRIVTLISLEKTTNSCPNEN